MLTGVAFDAVDVARLEGFWAEATRGRTGGLRLRFVAAEEPKEAGRKNRLHLDLAGGPGWEAEVERLLALGASRADIGQGDVPWDVLADPEGNEFCVLRPGHHGVRADSGVVAVCLDVSEEDRAAQCAFWEARSGWHAVESHPWGAFMRRTPDSTVSLVLGPPCAPKAGRNRVRPEVTEAGTAPGEYLDPAGNEFHVAR